MAHRGGLGAAAFLLAATLYPGASLQAQGEPFFKGKTIRIIVGFSPGGTFDLWARLFGQHVPKYIPGNPAVVVQNVPGGGSVVAGNYIYSVAKPDGLTLATFSPSLYIEQLMGSKEIQYDWGKFSWVINPESTDRIFYIRSDHRYSTIEDLRKAPEPTKCGATGIGTISHYFPRLLEEALGLKLTIVAGYQGSSDVNLALEKGEVQCWGGTVQAYLGNEPGRTWARTGFVRPLVQGGRQRDPKLPDVPTIWELMEKYKTPEPTKRLARVLLAADDFGRPYVGPPGIAADRLKILREGFKGALGDRELLAEAEKRQWGIKPIAGEELEAMAKEIVVQPPEVLQGMKRLLAK
ncbi:MAG TPA: tripartite tricarboxylate transporter substrate-binding protein [Candidatus Acidoferrales bacterium]|nr:tripartite tricarboxylate transporter substrate-binding protein [Candidatus Acidoferrales bacterium]